MASTPPLNLPLFAGLLGLEDRHVDLLHGARQDVPAEVRLVGVHADAPAALLLRREDAEAALAGDLEDDLRALRDLVQRDLLALGLIAEVLRVAELDLDRRRTPLRALVVPGDEEVTVGMFRPPTALIDLRSSAGSSP